MRTLTRDKQKMYYALLIGEQPQYVYDENGNKVVDYIDESGTVYYRETGETIIAYSDPVEFWASISLNAGDVQSSEYGFDISSYDASVVYLLNEFPITETTLIWFKSEPTYKNNIVDSSSADFKVASVKPSLNYTKLLLRKLQK